MSVLKNDCEIGLWTFAKNGSNFYCVYLDVVYVLLPNHLQIKRKSYLQNRFYLWKIKRMLMNFHIIDRAHGHSFLCVISYHICFFLWACWRFSIPHFTVFFSNTSSVCLISSCVVLSAIRFTTLVERLRYINFFPEAGRIKQMSTKNIYNYYVLNNLLYY